MKCKECEKEKNKSCVYPGMRFCTAGSSLSYYDEYGRLHTHDNNTNYAGYICSNGHEWHEEFKHSCWCGWPYEQKKVMGLSNE